MSFILAALACAFLPLAAVRPKWLAVSAAALLGVIALNRKFYAFFFAPTRNCLCCSLHSASLPLLPFIVGLATSMCGPSFQLRRVVTVRRISALKAVTEPLKLKNLEAKLTRKLTSWITTNCRKAGCHHRGRAGRSDCGVRACQTQFCIRLSWKRASGSGDWRERKITKDFFSTWEAIVFSPQGRGSKQAVAPPSSVKTFFAGRGFSRIYYNEKFSIIR